MAEPPVVPGLEEGAAAPELAAGVGVGVPVTWLGTAGKEGST